MNRLLTLLLAALWTLNLCASPSDPYPHEVENLRLYGQYIAPLRPGESDAKDVARVFGTSQRLERNAWTFEVLYSCKDDPVICSHGPRNDKVAEIVVTPKRRLSLAHQKFPSVFAHSYGAVSEINVACDVYKDDAGLEYWIVSKDSPSYKKGDLLQILYGSAKL